jgi:hypothetical protein
MGKLPTTINPQRGFYGRDITEKTDNPLKLKILNYKMKRGMKLAAFSIILAIFLSINALAIDANPTVPTIVQSSLVITGLRYEPYPVSPGEIFDVWIKIENRGNTAFNNATCILKPEFPFSLYQGQALKSYGKMNAGDAAVFQYKIKADMNVSEGNNELKVECTRDPSEGSWQINKINIMIQTRYPTLNLKEIRTDPEMISPGKEATLLFTLENQADSAMKDIDLKLNLPDEIAPSGEVAEKKLRMIEAGAVSDMMFMIKAMPDTEGGIYKIPFTLAYTDNLGKAYSQEGIIPVEVSSKPDLLFSIDSTSLSKSNKLGDAEIKIVNKGLTNLKFVTLEILDSDKFKLLSGNAVYIGDIDSDDFGTATFKISARTSKDFDIPLRLSARDAVNNEYTQTVNVMLKMLSNSELGKKSLLGTIITIIIVIFIALMIFMRKFRVIVVEKGTELYKRIFKRK